MVLKEAFRYINHINQLISDTATHLCNPDESFETKETHKRTLACPTATDEEIILTDGSEQVYTIEGLINFAKDLIVEKENVLMAIEECKYKNCKNSDAIIQANKSMNTLITYLKRLSGTKDKTSTRIGRAYTFNVEGNQVMYQYDIDVEFKAKFDREKMKETIKELQTISDERSLKIDQSFSNDVVEFTPKFDVYDTFDNIMETYYK